jgi:integrating conjugative element protein (TIGR03756 family)
MFFLLDRRWIGLFFSLCFWLFQSCADAQNSLATLVIVQNTLAAIPFCLHYKVIGMCYWLNCEGTACHVTMTPKVSHYLPDAVITVYRQTKSDPWDFARQVIDPVAYQAGEQQIQRLLKIKLGDGYESVSSSVDNDAHFKEVDVIGNPAITAFKKYNPLLLASVAKPLMPYYVSLADAYLWRSPQREIVLYPQNLIPGKLLPICVGYVKKSVKPILSLAIATPHR